MDNEKIGLFIASQRKEQKMTQKDLADKLHVTVQAVSKWERGKGCPDVSLLKPLSKIFSVTIGELLDGNLFEDENYKEKSDDILVKSLQKSEIKNKKNILFMAITCLGLFLMYFFTTMNAYREFRLILIISLVIIYFLSIFLIYRKFTKKGIPIFIMIILISFIFDYIGIKIYHVEPMYAIITSTSASEDRIFKKYQSIFYSAYSCGTDYWFMASNQNERSFCGTKVVLSSTEKEGTILSKEGYVYYLNITIPDNVTTINSTIFLEGYDLDTLFDRKEAQEIFLHDQNHYTIHGDADTSVAPKNIQSDLEKIAKFLSQMNIRKEIEESDLNNLDLAVVSKSEVVKLVNKVLDGKNITRPDIDIYKTTDTINQINYQITYLTIQNKIDQISIKTDNSNYKKEDIEEIKNLIIKNQTFTIPSKSKKSTYTDLYKVLESIDLTDKIK